MPAPAAPTDRVSIRDPTISRSRRWRISIGRYRPGTPGQAHVNDTGARSGLHNWDVSRYFVSVHARDDSHVSGPANARNEGVPGSSPGVGSQRTRCKQRVFYCPRPSREAPKQPQGQRMGQHPPQESPSSGAGDMLPGRWPTGTASPIRRRGSDYRRHAQPRQHRQIDPVSAESAVGSRSRGSRRLSARSERTVQGREAGAPIAGRWRPQLAVVLDLALRVTFRLLHGLRRGVSDAPAARRRDADVDAGLSDAGPTQPRVAKGTGGRFHAGPANSAGGARATPGREDSGSMPFSKNSRAPVWARVGSRPCLPTLRNGLIGPRVPHWFSPVPSTR